MAHSPQMVFSPAIRILFSPLLGEEAGGVRVNDQPNVPRDLGNRVKIGQPDRSVFTRWMPLIVVSPAIRYSLLRCVQSAFTVGGAEWLSWFRIPTEEVCIGPCLFGRSLKKIALFFTTLRRRKPDYENNSHASRLELCVSFGFE